uniref:Uncharacterized protein n=1 Tax=Anguilla anguilla TaxID=7936 RepID=A0A0E9TH78_ANGAN
MILKLWLLSTIHQSIKLRSTENRDDNLK